MGLIYSSSDSSAMMRALSSNLAVARTTTSELTAGCQQLIAAIDGHTLSGAAYNAGKGLFSELVIPTIHRMTAAVDNVQSDLAKYSAADVFIASEGFLDEDKLKLKIKIMKANQQLLHDSARAVATLAHSQPIPGIYELLQNAQRTFIKMADSMHVDKSYFTEIKKEASTVLETAKPKIELIKKTDSLEEISRKTIACANIGINPYTGKKISQKEANKFKYAAWAGTLTEVGNVVLGSYYGNKAASRLDGLDDAGKVKNGRQKSTNDLYVVSKNVFDIEQVRPLLKTEPNTAFFWSGRTKGVGGSEVAANVAKSKGGVTLETTIETKNIKMPEWDFNNPESMKAWDLASGSYAEQVSGEIRAVVGLELRKGNIWENVELPRLKNNPNVSKITIIDPRTGLEKIIFERK
ncbi:hypothetical protein [Enterococcus faecalis]|uniref:hypothetical protein n=1 Tax=Enterococcus faecalis TaxID=1351 RepID=UPI0022E8AFC3|nr:hypothetical protein [Enterococcus faecalis]